eukprot:PhF_6_TR37081/c3_g1_i2/m.54356
MIIIPLFFMLCAHIHISESASNPSPPDPITINLCYLFRTSSSAQSLPAQQAMFMYEFESPRYRSLVTYTFTFVNIGVLAKDALRRLLSSEVSSCDVFLGVGSSSVAVAIGPILEIPQLDFASTSLDLGDKNQYPFFARVVPTDEVIGVAMAKTAALFQWNLVNSICSNEPYGRTLSSSAAAQFTQLNVSVGLSRCVAENADVATLIEVLREYQTSSTRVLFLFMVMREVVLNALIQLGLHHTHVLVFSDSLCGSFSATNPLMNAMSGALCVSFSNEKDRVDRFLSQYAKRNVETYKQSLIDKQFPSQFINLNVASSVYSLLAADSVNHTMNAFFQAASNSVRINTTDRKSLYKLILGGQTDGLSGTVMLTSSGDRIGSHVVLSNVANGNLSTVAAWVGTGGYSLFGNILWFTNSTTLPNVVCGSGGSWKDNTCVWETSTSTTDLGLVFGVVFGAVVAMLIPIVWKLTENRRHLSTLLDNDKVATELAEATAIMDFEGVAYLDEIKNPTRIQLAFI